METLITIFLFVLTIGSASIVAFSKNLVYSAFALIGTFLGVAGVFVFLNAPFLGLVQLVVYAGGILVLIIFAVMLTSKISNTTKSNPVVNVRLVLPVMLLMTYLTIRVVKAGLWTKDLSLLSYDSTFSKIGDLLLTEYLLPFELLSLVLLVAMLGAAIISRRKVRE